MLRAGGDIHTYHGLHIMGRKAEEVRVYFIFIRVVKLIHSLVIL